MSTKIKEGDLAKLSKGAPGQFYEINKEVDVNEIIKLYTKNMWSEKTIANYKFGSTGRAQQITDLLIEHIGKAMYDEVQNSIRMMRKYS